MQVDGGRHPGIVLEWLREDAGWQARVAWTTGDGALSAWLDASVPSPV